MTATSPHDQLIEAVTDLFHAEYRRGVGPMRVASMIDEAEHDDCVRGALEAVIALVQANDDDEWGPSQYAWA